MGKFFLQTMELDPDSKKYVRYELHATSDIKVSTPSTTTNYPIEDGSSVTDNIVVQNKTLSLSGILTDVSTTDDTIVGGIVSALKSLVTGEEKNDVQGVDTYIKELQARIDNKETFGVHFSKRLYAVRDCVITNFRYSKTNKYGGEAWLINIDLKQIRWANRAEFVLEPAEDWANLAEKAKEEGGSTATLKDKVAIETALIEKGTIAPFAKRVFR